MAFERVDLKLPERDYAITLIPTGRTVRLSAPLAKAANIKSESRYDLYRDGNRFLIKETSVGVIRAFVSEKAGTYFRNVDLYYTLAVMDTEKKRKFPVEITAEGLLFTIGEEDGDTRK